jgi:hypothetical protein
MRNWLPETVFTNMELEWREDSHHQPGTDFIPYELITDCTLIQEWATDVQTMALCLTLSCGQHPRTATKKPGHPPYGHDRTHQDGGGQVSLRAEKSTVTTAATGTSERIAGSTITSGVPLTGKKILDHSIP